MKPDAGLPVVPARVTVPEPHDDVGADALHAYHARYTWPMGDAHAQASLDVETRTAADGRMTAWRYRAQAAGTDVAADDRQLPHDEAAEGADTGPAAPFAYRHAQTSIELADTGHAIPGHAHVFARESFVDELAGALRRDPVALRLQHLDAARDAGPREIIRMVSERAAWGVPAAVDSDAHARLSGRGFAFDGAAALSGNTPPPADARRDGDARWSAWVVDLDVDRATGDVAVRRVVAGQGAGEPGDASMAGLPAWQIEAAISRVMGARLSARPAHDETDMGAQPDAIAHELIAFDDTAHRAHGELSVHDARRIEQAAAPAAAAIANALYDATGVRFRAPPFDAERIRAALARPVPADSGEGLRSAPR
ncbi:cytochrome C, partial [Burkholderia sp. Ac-20344]|nr:cytochrome C [Burkholderia sp. Ac-20344]